MLAELRQHPFDEIACCTCIGRALIEEGEHLFVCPPTVGCESFELGSLPVCRIDAGELRLEFPDALMHVCALGVGQHRRVRELPKLPEHHSRVRSSLRLC